MADFLDIEAGREEKGAMSKLKEFGSAAVGAVKDAGHAVAGRVRSEQDPMQALSDVYCENKVDAATQKMVNFLKRKEKRFNELLREKERKERRLFQIEKKLAAAKGNSSNFLLREQQKMLQADIKNLTTTIRRQERDRQQLDERGKKNNRFKEMEKARSQFRGLSDEEKVQFAIKVVDKNIRGKEIAERFLEKAAHIDNNMKLSKKAQDMARAYRKEPSFEDIREANRMARDDNGRSTLVNAERTAKLENMDFGKDIRQSFSIKDEARSTKRADLQANKGAKPKGKENTERDDMTRSL